MLKRDFELIRSVGLFKQLSTEQIRQLHFTGLSRTPADRRLKALLASGHLRSLGRLPAPDDGGSACRVYQVGGNGWRIAGVRNRRKYKEIHPHMLRIADVYIELFKASQIGLLSFGYTLEVRIGGGPQADAQLTVTIPTNPEPIVYAVEVEVAEKDVDKIKEKLDAYVAVWNLHPNGFPYVIVVAADEDVEYKIAAVVDGMGEDAELFRVCRVETLVALLLKFATTRHQV